MSAPTHQTRRNRNAALAKLLAALNVCRAAGIAIDLVKIATAPDYLHIIVANTYLDADTQKLLVGPGTDWRRKWQACGKFEETQEETP